MNAERAHAMCAAADPLAVFVADPALWGELAGARALHQAVATAQVDLRGLLGDNVLN